jgi:hypothetical protein
MKSEFYRQIFEKVLNSKFYQNPSCGSRVVPCGQTDWHDEANSRFSQFCERSWKVNEKSSVRVTHYWTAFPKPLLPWKSNKNCIFSVRACAIVCVCARACVYGFPGAWSCTCAREALLSQHATHMRHIALPFVASMAPPYFSTLYHKRHAFRKKSYRT